MSNQILVMFVNSYLDRIREVLSGEFELISELLDPIKIRKLFESDCRAIIESTKSKKIDEEFAKRNFFLLKSYVVSQLSTHFEKLKKLAEEKGIEVNATLEPEVVNEIAMRIEEMEKEL